MYCTACGAQVPDDAKACAVCGSPMDGVHVGGRALNSQSPSNGGFASGMRKVGAVSPVQPGHRPGRSKIAVISIVAVAVVAAIAVGACFALGVVDAPWGRGAPAVPSDVEDGQAAVDMSDGEAPLEYSYKTVVLERYDANSGHNSNKLRFSYVQITCSEPNAVVDQLNFELKAEAEAAYAKKLTDEVYGNPTKEQMRETYYSYFNYGISYFEGGTACIMRMCGSLTPGAAHGQPYNQCSIVSLDTGEEMTAAQFVGVTDEGLRAMAWRAVDAYLPMTGEVWNSANEAFGNASPSGMVPEDAAIYYLSSDGVVALFEPYMLGSFAMGTPGLLVCDYSGKPIALAADYPLQVEESGQMTGLTESERQAEAAKRQAAEEAAKQAAEKTRAEEEARFAERKAQCEQTALAFATQYYTNGAFVNPDDDTQIQPTGNDAWRGLVLRYLEPGSAAVDMFESTFSGPIGGLGGFCFVKDAQVLESSAGRVIVEVRYLATQNPIPGWSNADGHAAKFACTFADSGLIDSYEIL